MHLRKGDYPRALADFQRAKAPNRDDPPLRYFAERAEAGAREDGAATDAKGSARHVRLLAAG